MGYLIYRIVNRIVSRIFMFLGKQPFET